MVFESGGQKRRIGRRPDELEVAFLFGVGYVVLSFFFRWIGGIDPKTGKPAGAEKTSVGAWVLLAAIVVGVLVATRMVRLGPGGPRPTSTPDG